MEEKYIKTLKLAFPSSLQNNIDNIAKIIIALLSRYQAIGVISHNYFEVIIDKEFLSIPYRIYFNDNVHLEAKTNSMSDLQKTILNCLLTRHHSGFIRQEFLRKIINCNLPWTVPFVFRLVGEYVTEILQEIYKNLNSLDKTVYIKFIQDNLQFYNLTKERLISYWNCYYRWLYKYKKDYVGFKILDFFES